MMGLFDGKKEMARKMTDEELLKMINNGPQINPDDKTITIDLKIRKHLIYCLEREKRNPINESSTTGLGMEEKTGESADAVAGNIGPKTTNEFYVNSSPLSEQPKINFTQYVKDNKLEEKKISKGDMIFLMRNFRAFNGHPIQEEDVKILFPVLITTMNTDQLIVTCGGGRVHDHYIVHIFDKNGKSKRGFRIGLDGNPENNI